MGELLEGREVHADSKVGGTLGFSTLIGDATVREIGLVQCLKGTSEVIVTNMEGATCSEQRMLCLAMISALRTGRL